MKNTQTLPALTSLRGIAALSVVLFHLDIIWIPLWEPGSHFLIRKAYLMVDFFFILSGFILSHVYGNLFSSGLTRSGLVSFFRARFARIYPLHFFSLVFILGLFHFFLSHGPRNPFDAYLFDFSTLPGNFLLLQGMGFHSYLSWNLPSWSISTEWWVYFLFPFLAPFLYQMRMSRVYLVLFVVMALYLLCCFYLYPLSESRSPFPGGRGFSLDLTYDFAFVRTLAGFILGMLVYDLHRRKWLSDLLGSGYFLVAMTAGLLVFMQLSFPDYLVVLFFPFLILAAVGNQGTGRKILEWRPLLFLGEISYSFYLMHFPVILAWMYWFYSKPALLSGTLNEFAWALVYLASLSLVSALTYRWVKVPFRRWIVKGASSKP